MTSPIHRAENTTAATTLETIPGLTDRPNRTTGSGIRPVVEATDHSGRRNPSGLWTTPRSPRFSPISVRLFRIYWLKVNAMLPTRHFIDTKNCVIFQWRVDWTMNFNRFPWCLPCVLCFVLWLFSGESQQPQQQQHWWYVFSPPPPY